MINKIYYAISHSYPVSPTWFDLFNGIWLHCCGNHEFLLVCTSFFFFFFVKEFAPDK